MQTDDLPRAESFILKQYVWAEMISISSLVLRTQLLVQMLDDINAGCHHLYLHVDVVAL